MSLFNPRPNTQDSFIIKEVYEDNCYNLPEDLSGITIIDIGANIGAFVAACVERNAKKVIAFEPNPESFIELIKLTKDWRQVRCFSCAVTGKQYSIVRLSNSNYLDEIELTGGNFVDVNNEMDGIDVYSANVEKMLTLTLDNSNLVDPNRPPVWIKMDCEGSEHEIMDGIMKMQFVALFESVKRIFGEVHTTIDNKLCSIGPEVNFTLPSHEYFKSKLEQLGFKVKLDPNPNDPHLALFWAEKG